MKAYSNDLREKIAAACQRPGQRQYAVAAQFGVSLSFVAKLLRRQRTSGTVAAKPWAGGPARCLDTAAQARLVALVAQQPDATLAELRDALLRERGQRVSLGTVWRVLTEHDWRRKKKRSMPLSATRPVS
jgi:transposase